MRFVNPGEARQVRIQEGPERFRWECVRKGEAIDLTPDIGFNYGFKEVKATEGSIGETKVETKQLDSKKKKEDYKRK